ncbi:MAG: ComF family protein [Candidatus Hinthialibacter antarcticus]|nr:ComF family protein [Candidatus Hinthialibacter antarcticus]
MPLATAHALFQTLIDLIYPPVCAGCGGEVAGTGPPVCEACLLSAPRIEKPLCQTCGAPGENPHAKHCPECPEKAHYHRARAVLDYQDKTVKKLIQGLKFHYQTGLAVPLGDLMLEGFNQYFKDEQYDAIVPVPLHRKRKRQREFNQATLLAQAIQREHNLPMIENAVMRIRHTKPQTSMTPLKRKTNVLGAFAVKDASVIQGAQLLLVDDIYTTGSTTNEIARVLIEAGAKHVDVLTLSRSLMNLYRK